MAISLLTIESVGTTLLGKMVIPPYQRPYTWDERLVRQLLQDLQLHQDKPAYRLGTLVFHQEQGKIRQVVDGQQRLLTLALLWHALQDEVEIPLLKQPITHSLAQRNLRANAALIQNHLTLLGTDDKVRLRTFLENRCECVVLVLSDISEAFQFFDSQNSRGRELEPYDLLKAYHLRAMVTATESERRTCVEAWEHQVAGGNLKAVFDHVLFRIRSWLQGQSGREFRKSDVGLFKGVQLDHEAEYPYLQALRIQDHFTRQYGQDPVRAVDRQKAVYPFQIGQVMLDGQRFFEYVEHYTEMCRLVALDLPQLDTNLYEVLNTYEGRRRDGDVYTRTLFDCVVFCYFDKFGHQGLQAFLPKALAWAYAMRLTQTSVRLATMDNKALSERNLFGVIRTALRPQEVLMHPVEPIPRTKADTATKVEALKEHLDTLGYLTHA